MIKMKTQNIRTIVVIDDEVKLTKVLGQLLAKNDFTVHTFEDGRRAMEFLARERADLVITDLYMDHMDGMEIVKTVKNSYPAIKIIVMSGGSQVVDMDCLTVAKMIGADRSLDKPVKLEVLLSTIRELDAELPPERPRPGGLKSISEINKDKD
jgi:two-component system response regulator GlrR